MESLRAAETVVQRSTGRTVSSRDKWFGGSSSTVAGPVIGATVVSLGGSAGWGGNVPTAFIYGYRLRFRVVLLLQQAAAVASALRDVMFRVWRDGIVGVIKLRPGGRQKMVSYFYESYATFNIQHYSRRCST